MPLYHFHIDADVPPQAVTERLNVAVRKKLGFRQNIREMFTRGSPSGPPFIGSVDAYSFRIRRDIRYRNSFLPLIWGRIVSTPQGARVNITMFLHPFVSIFMLFVLWDLSYKAFTVASGSFSFFLGIIIFVVFCLAGFIPEAVKARRLLCKIVLSSGSNDLQQPTPQP